MEEQNEIVKVENPMQVVQGSLQLSTIDDLWRTAKMFVQSGLCPQTLNTPAKVVVCLQAGAELGFKPWQSLQSLHVINGRVGLEGQAMLALVRKSRVCEYIRTEFVGKPYEDDFAAVVKSKRLNETVEYTTDFSVADAKLAKLWSIGKDSAGKDNWAKYPKDMLTWRAVSRHCKRYYSDETSGMYSVDELESIEPQPLKDTFVPGVAGVEERLEAKKVESQTLDKQEPGAIEDDKEAKKAKKAAEDKILKDAQTKADKKKKTGKKATKKKKEAKPKVQTCRVCGCTDDKACVDKETGETCTWVEEDLCSKCKKKLDALGSPDLVTFLCSNVECVRTYRYGKEEGKGVKCECGKGVLVQEQETPEEPAEDKGWKCNSCKQTFPEPMNPNTTPICVNCFSQNIQKV